MNKKAKSIFSGIIISLILIFSLTSYFVLADSPEEEPVIWKRTATTTIYRNPDGTYTRTIGQGIINYDDGSRRFPNFIPINTTLVHNEIEMYGVTYDYYRDLNLYEVYFKEKSGTTDPWLRPIMVKRGNYVLTMSPQSLKFTGQTKDHIQQSTAVSDGRVITYENQFKNIDLRYSYNSINLKEELIIDNFEDLADIGSPSQDDDLILKFKIRSYNIESNNNTNMRINGEKVDFKDSITTETDEEVYFLDENNETIYYFAKPIAYDSGGSQINLNYSLDYNLFGNLVVEVFTPYSWLSNESRVYPVYIDPTITLQDADTENLEDVYFMETDGREIGSLIKFNISSIPGGVSIDDAILRLYMDKDQGTLDGGVNIYRITNQSWIETMSTANANLTWFQRTDLNDTQSISSVNPTWKTLDVGTIVSNGYSSGNDNLTIGIEGVDFTIDGTGIDTVLGTEDSFAIGYDAGPGGDYYWFASKEDADTSLRPYLNITYTPYVDIISPTPSQIITNDDGNMTLNVTTNVSMDECRYSFSSGATNYTMTNVTGLSFNATNTTMVDGSHTVIFYCNQSSDGTWRDSDTVDFDVDSVNVTVCRDLTVENREYDLLNNITVSLGSFGRCMYLKSNNISVDLNGNTLNEFTNLGYGIYVPNVNDSTIKNGFINDFGASGIFLFRNKNGNISNISLSSSSLYQDGISTGEVEDSIFNNITIDGLNIGIEILKSSNNNFTNIIIKNVNRIPENNYAVRMMGKNNNNSFKNISISDCATDEECIFIYHSGGDATNGNIFEGISMTGTGGGGIRLRVEGVNSQMSNNLFKNIKIDVTTSSINFSVGAPLSSEALNNTFLNVTYDIEGLETDSTELIRKWYFETEVNDSAGSPIQNTNVTIYNVSDAEIHSELTNSSGNIARQELIDYINDGGVKSYNTPHTINITKTNYITNSTIYNLTTENNVDHQVILKIRITTSLNKPNDLSTQPTPTTFNCSAITGVNDLTNITLRIWNSTGDIYYNATNTTIGLSNESIQVVAFTYDDTLTWNCLAYNNISESSWADSNYTVYSSITHPAINLDAPSDHTNSSNGNDTYFNYTTTDTDGLDTCQLWGNWTGTWHKNYSWVGPTSGTQNYTTVNISEGGPYRWNVWCNDTLGNGDFSSNNYTFTIDETNPNVTFTTANDTSVTGTLSITIDYNVSDTYLKQCSFTLRDSNGTVHNYPENTSLTCSATSKSISTLSFGTFVIQMWGEDYSGNLGDANLTFTLIGEGAGGSGGVGVIPEEPEPEVIRTFCGDGVCQPEGNDYGIKEDWYNCQIDCQPFDFDALVLSFTKYCWDKDPSTICFWGIGNIRVEEEMVVCGDGICQPSEHPWNCEEDCGRFNMDILYTGCVDDDEFTPCFFSTNLAFMALFAMGAITLAISFLRLRVPWKKEKVSPYKYIAIKLKGRRKRRY